MSDQENANEEGYFLGWNMMLWGSSIDPSTVKTYEIPLEDIILPRPHPDTTHSTIEPTPTTRTHPKPTDHLPGDHGSAEGEKTKPAFDGSSRPNGTSTPTVDEGWFPGMSSLVSHQKWFFVAFSAVVVFGVGAAIYFWRRRRARLRRADYSTIPAGEDLPMSNINTRDGRAASSGTRTRELYDAFGEVSDDDDADEETRLQGGRPQDRSPGGLAFHSGFLDDEEAPGAGATPSGYKDEPDEPEPSSALGPHQNPENHPEGPATVSGYGTHSP